MTDPAFVAGAYAIVVGGILAYAATIGRRLRAARREAASIEGQLGHPHLDRPPDEGVESVRPAEASR